MTNWTHRYLELARQVSLWSKDPSSQLGAVAIGSDGQILSQGFNGFPRGIEDDDRLFNREEKYDHIVHAEMNVIYNACLNGVSLKGSTLYVFGLPVCHLCSLGIIQVGVKDVIMAWPTDQTEKALRWQESWSKTKSNFEEAKVAYAVYGYEGPSEHWIDTARPQTRHMPDRGTRSRCSTHDSLCWTESVGEGFNCVFG